MIAIISEQNLSFQETDVKKKKEKKMKRLSKK